MNEKQMSTYGNLSKHGRVVLYPTTGRFEYVAFHDPNFKFGGVIAENGEIITIFTK